jgi:hypothetical protein
MIDLTNRGVRRLRARWIAHDDAAPVAADRVLVGSVQVATTHRATVRHGRKEPHPKHTLNATAFAATTHIWRSRSAAA